MGKSDGLTYKTAWRMWRDGRPPVPTEQLATGTVRVHPQKAETIDAVALYARVFSADQKSDLERQIGRLARYASREELTVVRSVSEIGSGLNGHRTKVMRLVADPSVHTIVVEHRGRLVRFGSEYIETAMSDSGRKVVVVDQTEMKDDLVQDNRAAKALAAAATQTPDDAA